MVKPWTAGGRFPGQGSSAVSDFRLYRKLLYIVPGSVSLKTMFNCRWQIPLLINTQPSRLQCNQPANLLFDTPAHRGDNNLNAFETESNVLCAVEDFRSLPMQSNYSQHKGVSPNSCLQPFPLLVPLRGGQPYLIVISSLIDTQNTPNQR